MDQFVVAVSVPAVNRPPLVVAETAEALHPSNKRRRAYDAELIENKTAGQSPRGRTTKPRDAPFNRNTKRETTETKMAGPCIPACMGPRWGWACGATLAKPGRAPLDQNRTNMTKVGSDYYTPLPMIRASNKQASKHVAKKKSGLDLPSGGLPETRFSAPGQPRAWDGPKTGPNGSETAQNGPKRPQTAPRAPRSGTVTLRSLSGAHGKLFGDRGTPLRPLRRPFGSISGRFGPNVLRH